MKSTLFVLAAFAAASSYGAVGAPALSVAAMQDGFARAGCVDSEGAMTGFFCQPRTLRGAPVRACADRRRDVASCHAASAQAYCTSRNFRMAQAYQIDARGNLVELVCTRPGGMMAGAPLAPVVPMAPAATTEWQPIYNANISGYDRREFGLRRGQDWKACRAACDADSGCNGWTLSNNNNTCYLKWDGNPELVQYDTCCTTGLKGMESGGPASVRARIRGGGY